jgi:lysophospholipase L1-like esterase
VDGATRDESPPPATPAGAIDTAKILAEYARNLGRMSDLARARGADLLIAFQPFLGSKRELAPGEQKIWSDWRASYPGSHDRFREQYAELVAGAAAFCVERGISCVDLTRDERFLTGEVELYSDTVHLNAEGHRRLAAALLERLQPRSGSAASAQVP